MQCFCSFNTLGCEHTGTRILKQALNMSSILLSSVIKAGHMSTLSYQKASNKAFANIFMSGHIRLSSDCANLAWEGTLIKVGLT